MTKIAVFGLGSIGSRHVRNLLEMGETDLLGCDVRIGQEDFTPDLPIQIMPTPLTSAASMVWDWKPDVVLVCVPPAMHYGIAIEALKRDSHVFIEKPMALNVEEAGHLLYAANENEAQLAVGYQLPFNSMPFTRWIGTGTLHVTHAQDMSQWPSQYQKDVLDEFSHEIHLAVRVHGPVKELVAYEREAGLRWNIELMHLHARSSIQLFAGPGPYLRFAHLDGMTGRDELNAHWYFDRAKNDQAYKDELRAFLDACHGKAWDDRLCSGAEAAHVVRVIQGCRESTAGCNVVRI